MDATLEAILAGYKGPKLTAGVIKQISRFRDGDMADKEANALIEMLGPDADELLFSGMEDEESEDDAVTDFGDGTLSEEELAWQRQYMAQEDEIRRKEAEMLQKLRDADVERIEQEIMIKKASRQLALGIGTSALKLAKTMNLLAGEIDSRVSGNIKEITAAEMRAYIQSGANLIEKSTKALKVAMELERIEEKQMLAGMNGQEEEEMTPEDALETMSNLREVGDLIEMTDDKE